MLFKECEIMCICNMFNFSLKIPDEQQIYGFI
jgi:hypothetical protein